MLPREGYQLERQANYAVALQLDLDDELRREGAAREVVHAIQNARKGAGLQVEDRIDLTLSGDDALIDAVRQHADYVAGETLAANLALQRRDGRGNAHRDGAHRRLRARHRAAPRGLEPSARPPPLSGLPLHLRHHGSVLLALGRPLRRRAAFG